MPRDGLRHFVAQLVSAPLFRCFASGRLGLNCSLAGLNRPRYTNEKGPLQGPFIHLVAGARYVNYMQIGIEPFPLVA